VSFDEISGGGARLFCEVYGRDRASVLAAKRELATLGYSDSVSITYDQLV
jgi:hypothetical protein